ncbi:M20/M25/M40 family metallo-hydrolase [Aliikangiella sp. IMCC44653]
MKLIFKFIIISFLFAATAKAVTNPNLTAQEEKIVQSINQNLANAESLLLKTVNINSGTMNFAGIKAVANVYRAEFDALGFTTRFEEGSAFARAGHLIAEYGTGDLKILMIGHLDTVFALDDPFQKAEKLSQQHIKGPGITDMKGGNVIIIEVLRSLKSLQLLDNVSIRVILTGDEEKSGKPLSLSKQSLIEAGQWADIALGFEDGDGDINTAVTARRGASGWTLTVTGKAAHSSQVFREDIGFGAIYETARILNEFREQLTKHQYLTVNPGIVMGGTTIDNDFAHNQASAFGKSNIIAKTAIVTGDIRALSPQQEATAKALMQKIAANNLPHTSATLTFEEGYPSMAPTKGNTQLLGFYNQISRDLGYNPVTAVNPRRAGAADISFVANNVVMALDGLGLMGDGGHTKDEIADMTSFAKNMHKAALLIYRLSQSRPAKPAPQD